MAEETPDTSNSNALVKFFRDALKEVRKKNDDLTKERDEALATAKKANDDLSAALRKAETDVKTAQQEAAKASERATVDLAIKSAATKAGLQDLDQLKLLDLTGITVKPDGSVDGIDKVLVDLKTKKPFLFGVANTSQTEPPPKQGNVKPFDARKAKPEERDAEWARIKDLK